MPAQNPFPAPATADGFQVISSSCSETDTLCLSNGNFLKMVSLVNVPTVGLPLTFQLTYNSQASTATPSPVGNKWRHNYMANLIITGMPATLVTYVDPSGRSYDFIPSGSDWVLKDTSYYFTGTLVENANNWQIQYPDSSVTTFDTSGNLLCMADPFQNYTNFLYSGGNLVTISEPKGRTIQLGYTGSFITSVTDPNENPYTLVYDVTNSNLTKIMGPAGCTTQYGYTTPANSLITTRTDPNLNVYTYGYNGSSQLTSVQDAESPSNTISYAYDTVDEYIADDPITTQTLSRTTLTDALSQAWEWRFDLSGKLWRAIVPVDTTNGVYHWRRFYWDQNQKLLYHTSGYPLINNYSGTGDMAGPRDGTNNLFRKRVNDPTLAVPLQNVQATGQATQRTYNSARRVTSVSHGQAHYGVQGNWVGEYGQDGYVLCSFESTSADVQSLPSYISSVSMGTATRQRMDDDSFYHHLMDPRTPVSATSLKRGNGYWQSGSAFTMTFDLNTAQAFNLSFYTASTDQEYSSNTPLQYNEQMGRDVTLSVTDMNGTQTYNVTNNAPGVWVTFPVQGDGSNAVTVTLSPSGLNSTDARISAIMFDPLESHTVNLAYDPITNQPTLATDPLGNSSSTFYNLDGTVAINTDPNGNPVRYFYEDAYKNQTRVRDAYGNDTVKTFDNNGNVLTKTDANKHTWTYTYDGKNRVLTTTDPLGNITSNTYDPAGNLLTTTDANGNGTQYEYTPTNRLKKVTDAAGNVTQKVYTASGNVYTITDPNSNVTTFTYDNANRVVKTVQADSTEIQNAFDVHGNLVAVTSPNGNQGNVTDINTTGAANLFYNADIDFPNPTYTTSAAQDWDGIGAGTLDNSVSHDGLYSLLLFTDTTFGDNYFRQKNVNISPGIRGLASFWTRPDGSSDVTSVQASLILRQTDGSTLESMSPSLALPTGSTTWQQLPLWQFDVPGSGQFVSFPADEFRAYGTAATNTPQVWFDTFMLYSLSTAMTYDANSNLVQTTLPDGTTVKKVFDRYGRLSQLVDAKENIASLTYNALNQVVATTDANGNQTTVTYDAVGNRLTVTDPNNNTTTTTYDKLNRPVMVTYPDGSTEKWAYDPVGNVIAYTNSRGESFTYVYDAANRRVQKIYNTDSTSVTYGRDPVGNLTSRIERNGDVSWFTYDAVNRRVAVQRNPATGFSSTSSWLQASTYDANSNRTAFYNGTAATGAVYGTDVYGTGVYVTPPLQWQVPGGGYDSMNRLLEYEDESSNETSMTYDVEGRATDITFPNGSPAVATSNTYDIVGHLLGSDTAQGATDFLPLTNSYDENSNRIAVTTGTDTYDYAVDALNQLVQEDINRFVERSMDRFKRGTLAGVDSTSGALTLTELPDPFSGALINGDKWRLSYTNNVTNGNIAGGIEVRQIDGNGLSMVFPRAYCNTLTNFDSGSTVSPPTSGYGLCPNLVWVAAEHRVPLTGDCDLQVDFNDWQGHPTGAEGYANLVLMIANTSTENVWDSGGNSFVQMSINTTPQYSAVISNNGTVTNGTVSTSDTSGKFRITRSADVVTAYYWDGSAWVSLLTASGYPTGGTFYISLSLVIQAMGHGQFANFESNLDAYATSGTYTSTIYDAGRSVTWDSITWDATLPGAAAVAFQVATASSVDGPFTFVGPDGTSGTYFTTSGTSIFAGTTGQYAQYQVTLTGDGTVTPTLSRVDVLFGGTNTSQENAYTYDPANNMTVKVTEVAGSDTVTETRTINDLNQVTANSVVSGNTTTDWSFTFDLSGNMLTRTNVTLSETTTYTWDEDNRLTLVQLPDGSSVGYTYDVLGRMLTRTYSGDAGPSLFVWDGMDCIQETDPSGNVTRYYIVNGVLRSFMRNSDVYQVHSDALGSVRAVTDASGTVVANYDFEAYGLQLASTSDSVPDGGMMYRFVGARGVRWDEITGLYYMRARWYDPLLGRFLSRDSKRNLNLYSYAANNPSITIDPSGLNALVIYSAPIPGSLNVEGHIAVAVTGGGVFSYGTGTPVGSSLFTYLVDQLQKRDVMIIDIPTTSQNDAAMINLGMSYGPLPNVLTGITCATRTDSILAKGNIDLSGILSIMRGSSSIPIDVFNAAVVYAESHFPGTTAQILPQYSTVPSSLSSFEPAQ